jgi:hypothetical protein
LNSRVFGVRLAFALNTGHSVAFTQHDDSLRQLV